MVLGRPSSLDRDAKPVVWVPQATIEQDLFEQRVVVKRYKLCAGESLDKPSVYRVLVLCLRPPKVVVSGMYQFYELPDRLTISRASGRVECCLNRSRLVPSRTEALSPQL